MSNDLLEIAKNELYNVEEMKDIYYKNSIVSHEVVPWGRNISYIYYFE